jgi:hypothetical protein
MEEPDKDAILKVIEALLRDNKLKKLIWSVYKFSCSLSTIRYIEYAMF